MSCQLLGSGWAECCFPQCWGCNPGVLHMQNKCCTVEPHTIPQTSRDSSGEGRRGWGTQASVDTGFKALDDGKHSSQ